MIPVLNFIYLALVFIIHLNNLKPKPQRSFKYQKISDIEFKIM